MPAELNHDPTDVAGWAVSVLTERMGGGEPMVVLYGSAIEQRSDAIAAICLWLGYLPGDGVGEVFPLSRATVIAMHKQQGEIWMF